MLKMNFLLRDNLIEIAKNDISTLPDIFTLCQTNKEYNNICNDSFLWNTILKYYFPDIKTPDPKQFLLTHYHPSYNSFIISNRIISLLLPPTLSNILYYDNNNVYISNAFSLIVPYYIDYLLSNNMIKYNPKSPPIFNDIINDIITGLADTYYVGNIVYINTSFISYLYYINKQYIEFRAPKNIEPYPLVLQKEDDEIMTDDVINTVIMLLKNKRDNYTTKYFNIFAIDESFYLTNNPYDVILRYTYEFQNLIDEYMEDDNYINSYTKLLEYLENYYFMMMIPYNIVDYDLSYLKILYPDI